jgi:hypothetical protein
VLLLLSRTIKSVNDGTEQFSKTKKWHIHQKRRSRSEEKFLRGRRKFDEAL